MTVTAAILCGGQGTRLRPVIGDLPKCLAPVAGRPFLSYVLENLNSQGVERFVLCLGHGHKQVTRVPWKCSGDTRVFFSIEEEPLGTGGALRNALPLLDTDPVLVVNGDTFCKFELNSLLQEYNQNPVDGCLPPSMKSCLLLQLFGPNPEDNGKPVARWDYVRWTHTGVWLASPAALRAVFRFGAEPFRMEELMGLGDVAARFRVAKRTWEHIDIGTPEGYAAAEGFLREQGAIKT